MANQNNTYSSITFNPTPVNFTPVQSSGRNVSYSGLIGSGVGMINGILDRIQERRMAREQQQWNEQMMDKQNEWSLDMWNRTNEYNSPSAQIARLRDAGLNPLYYGLDGTSANGLESAQPLGYDRASMKGLANPLQSGIDNYMAMKSMDKDIELKNAQIDKMEAEKSGIELDNEWKDKTQEARVEAENLKNSLTDAQIKLYHKEREKAEQDIKESIERTKSEIERQGLIEAQKILAKAQADEIVALLPYKELLIQAETVAQKASAAASFALAAKENKLIDDGYYDELIRRATLEATKAGFDCDDAEIQAALDEYKLSLKNGTAFKRARELDGKKAGVVTYVVDKTFQAITITADAVGGAVMAVVAGVGAGRAVNKNKDKRSDTLVLPSNQFGSNLSPKR